MLILAPAHQLWWTALRSRAIARFPLNITNVSRPALLAKAFSMDAWEDTPTERALRQPYPPEPVNTQFFENVTDEYTSPQSESSSSLQVQTSSVPQTYSPSDILVRMICRGEFNGLEAARAELEGLRIPIEQNAAYAEAVYHALRAYLGEERRSQFWTWLSLVPSNILPDMLQKIAQRLLHYPIDWILIREYALHCISYGFAYDMAQVLFPSILRYAPFSVSQEVMIALENVSKTPPQGGESKQPLTLEYVRALAIETHSESGRPHLALALLMKSHEEKIAFEPALYDIVWRALDGDFAQPRVLALKTEVYPRLSIAPSLRKKLWPVRFKRIPRSSLKHFSTPALKTAVHVLHRAIASSNPAYFASFLADLMPHISRYSGMRTPEILSLRREVFSRGNRSLINDWVAAEQLYYNARNWPLHSIRCFMHYCIGDGIPDMKKLSPLLSRPNFRERAIYRRRRPLYHDHRVHNRVSPSATNIQLAWQAIVKLAREPGALEHLYQYMLAQLDYFNRSSASTDPGSDGLRSDAQKHLARFGDFFPPEYNPSNQDEMHTRPLSIAAKPNAAFFLPFIITFSHRVGPLRGAHVVDDMRQRGIEPDKAVWAGLAGAFARDGYQEEVMTVLQHIDQEYPIPDANPLSSPENVNADGDKQSMSGMHWTSDGDRSTAVDAESHAGNGSAVPSYRKVSTIEREGWEAQWSTLITYNNAMRGFIECGMYAAARNIQRRIKEKGLLNFDGTGRDKKTRGLLHMLSRYEKGHEKWNSKAYRRRSTSLRKRRIRAYREIVYAGSDTESNA